MAGTKVRIYELAKELDLSNKDLMTLLEKEFGVVAKSHASTVEDDVVKKVVAKLKGKATKAPAAKTPAKAAPVSKAPAAEKKPVDAAAKTPVPKAAPAKPEATKPTPVTSKSTSAKAPAAVKPASVKKDAPPAPAKAPESEAETKPAKQGVATLPRPAETTTKPLPAKEPLKKESIQPIEAPPTRAPEIKAAPEPLPARKPAPAPIAARVETPKPAEPTPEAPPEPKVVEINETVSVAQLAKILEMRETEIIKQLFMQGMSVTINKTFDPNTARSLARKLGFEAPEPEVDDSLKHQATGTLLDQKQKPDAKKFKNLQPRPPVVSIMGHVDHGKTTLLDAIRETRHKLVDAEAGGITQTIGAYTVEKDDHKIVFLDTPGHEAFTAMRARGAKATDIAILVVAADDGVMPQTIEAINHAKAAGIPIIVAVNKIDKEGADPDRVLTKLSEYGLVSEKWGGDTVTAEVSALQKVGLESILEMILLVAELLELKADPTVPAEGVVIEASLDKQKGPVATVLLQNGTLRVGENVVMGAVGGRVRALINDSGERVEEAGPAMPVEILGLTDVPRAGEVFRVIGDEREYRQTLQTERIKERDDRLMARSRLQGLMTRTDDTQFQQEGPKELNIILKADTHGAMEAAQGSINSLTTDEVRANILHAGTGNITEADVMLAVASHAVIIGFNVKEDNNAQRIAEQERIPILTFEVIYHLSEKVRSIMEGKLSPVFEEVKSGEAEVRQLFKSGKSMVAGCMVLEGKVVRNAKARVMREGREVFTGVLDNLKRFKEDAKDVAAGFECGISFDKFNDLQEGDIIQVYIEKEKARTL